MAVLIYVSEHVYTICKLNNRMILRVIAQSSQHYTLFKVSSHNL